MIFVLRKCNKKGGCLWVESSFNKNLWGGIRSWVILDDVMWGLSREEFVVDTFVWCKKVERRVIMFSGSVILNWMLSNKKVACRFFNVKNFEAWIMDFFLRNSFESSGYFFWRMFGKVIKTLKCLSLTFVKSSIMQINERFWCGWIKKSMSERTQFA